MRRFVLGTAGHVDHGKTALVRALTGVETDRLPEEKRRGITIELGFAPWDLGDGIEVSVIDVPGHRRLVHTMIAGAIGMEVVLLVVAADEGVMPQTREHVAACELLGLGRAVVAVTKSDRVGEDLAALAGEEARELLGSRFEAEVVVCSSRTGAGIDAVRAAVRRTLQSLGPPRAAPRARLSVDRAFSVKGAGTVVTGTLVEGRVAVGGKLFVVGEAGRRETMARALHVHDRPVDAAEAPTRLAVNLAGLTLEDVHRGDVVTDDERVAATRVVDVALRTEAPLRPGTSASLYVGTARSTARVDPLGAVPIAPEGPRSEGSFETVARLRLHRPIVVVGGDRFVLRGSDVEGPSGAVLGGGVALDTRPPRSKPRARRRAVLEALRAADAPAAVRAIVAEAAPRPLPKGALDSRFVLPTAELEAAAETLATSGELCRIKGSGYASRAGLVDFALRARALVAQHHKDAPLDRGLGRETLRRQLAQICGAEVAEEAIRLAAGTIRAPKDSAADAEPKAPPPPLLAEVLVIDGDVVRLKSFTAAPPEGALGSGFGAATRAVIEAGLRGVSENALREAVSVTAKETRAILAKLVRDNIAVHAGDLWFSRAALDELRTRVVAHLERDKRLTIADFKALTGLGRKQSIPLLEQLDREGVTRREGDDRVPGRA